MLGLLFAMVGLVPGQGEAHPYAASTDAGTFVAITTHDAEVVGALVEDTGRIPWDSTFQIAAYERWYGAPPVAASGDGDFIVAWGDAPDYLLAVRFARVGTDGSVGPVGARTGDDPAVAGGRTCNRGRCVDRSFLLVRHVGGISSRIVGSFGGGEDFVILDGGSAPSVAWDGNSYLVVATVVGKARASASSCTYLGPCVPASTWLSTSAHIVAVRVLPDGSVLSPVPVATAAAVGRCASISWTECGPPAGGWLVAAGARLFESGSVRPVVAAGPSGFLVVWSESSRIRAARISSEGLLVDPLPSELGEGTHPAVAWMGERFAVAWTSPAADPPQVHGVHVDPSGAVEDPFSIEDATHPTVTRTAGGGTAVVTWRPSDEHFWLEEIQA